MNEELLKTSINLHKDVIAIFKNNTLVLTNSAFNRFFAVNSTKDYNCCFGNFVDNFVPHPNYFSAEKLEDGEDWKDVIECLSDNESIVSILSTDYTPYAFDVKIYRSKPNFTIVKFTDVSQELIKKLMIDNGANIDVKTGAYTKDYFTYIMPSLQDAASFNKKDLAITQINLENNEDASSIISEIAKKLKCSIRNEDMLIAWSKEKFLLVYLVESKNNIEAFEHKINTILKNNYPSTSYKLNSNIQNENETMIELIKRL